MSTVTFATGYKVCFFHNVEYAYIPVVAECPWSQDNLPPENIGFPPGQHDTVTHNPNAVPKTELVHSPECFNEHEGGMW